MVTAGVSICCDQWMSVRRSPTRVLRSYKSGACETASDGRISVRCGFDIAGRPRDRHAGICMQVQQGLLLRFDTYRGKSILRVS